MLHARLSLLSKYLSSLPQSYLTDSSISVADFDRNSISHPILRTLLATLSRIPLTVPVSSVTDQKSSNFASEIQSERSDVALVQLLSALTQSAASAKELGRKSAIVESAKVVSQRRDFFPQVGLGHPGGDEWDGVAGLGSPENMGGPTNIMSMLGGRNGPS